MLDRRVRAGRRFLLVVTVILASASGLRAGEEEEIKLVQQAGGKVRILPLQTTRHIDVNLAGCAKADEVLRKIEVLRSAVSHLDLAGSGVSDDGLKALAGSARLRYLNLSGTAVTDAALAHLKDLPLLSQLELAKTRVSPEGLKQLQTFRRLGTLSVSTPALSDSGLKNLCERKHLVYLTLIDGTELTDAGLGELKKISGLFGLRFHNCAVTAALLEGLQDSKNLRVLSVTQTKLTPEMAKAIRTLTQVTDLDLSDTGYTLTGADVFPNARFLRLGKVKLTPAGLEALVKMKDLHSLALNGTDLTDEMLSQLVSLKSLSTLDLSETKVTDAGIQVLKDSKHLRYLHLKKTAVTPDGARKLKSSLQATHIFRE